MGKFTDWLKHSFSIFKYGNDPPSDVYYSDQFNYPTSGVGYSYRPDRTRLTKGNERSIVNAIFNRIALDVAAISIEHVQLDDNGRFEEKIDSSLNECLTVSANIDQTSRAFIQDIVLSMFDEGCVAVVPVETTMDPSKTGSYDILSMRTGKITEWMPMHIKVNVYNEKTGNREDIIVPKSTVAIIENPLYSVMNEPSSTLKRLIRKMNLLDAVDEQSGSGKLDLIIQLPYVIKSKSRQEQAEMRRKQIEEQLAGSKYGIAYTDGTEHITQLNRPTENNLMGQIEYLTKLLYSQLGITDEIMNGTASESAMLNYNSRTIEPIVSAIVDEFRRKFLTKTARTQGKSIVFFRDNFKLVPAEKMADIADKFTRNEILTSNEVRQIVGMRPSDDPDADELRNKNLNKSKEERDSGRGTENLGEEKIQKGEKSKQGFWGWATRNDLRCSDGVTIRKDAFAECDGTTVPLVWNHGHSDPSNVLGHAYLENRPEGVYSYGYFNDTQSGRDAKTMLQHGDVNSLSIWANKIRKNGSDVVHGVIRELSLVLSGANPGAKIEEIIMHGEIIDDEFVLEPGEAIEMHVEHSEKEETKEKKEEMAEDVKTAPEKSEDEETVKDVIDTMNEKQKKVMYALIGEALSAKDNEKEEDEDNVKHNIFDTETEEQDVLSHSEEVAIFEDAKRYGSLKDSAIAHGITDIDYLFPDAKNVTNTPEFIKRDTDWVSKVMNGTHHTPFSRIKSIFANLTADEARARGYIKGNLKVEEVIALLKRSTTPTTIYKKQKLDRDDVIDITDFDVVAWLKSEMRMMLDEEIARAILVSDGRSSSSDDKINELNIRPIWTDADLYSVKANVVGGGAKAFIRAAIKSRKDYKGSGSPTLYTTEDVLTDCLLLEDNMGRVIYDTEEKLKTALRVKEIVTVPVMENLSRTVEGVSHGLMGIIVNLKDYNVGADKGGAVSMFDDFDIDYNQQKYLIETRCSGALVKPYSAIVLESVPATEPVAQPEG